MIFSNRAAFLTLEHCIIPTFHLRSLTPTENKQEKKEGEEFQKGYAYTLKEIKLCFMITKYTGEFG